MPVRPDDITFVFEGKKYAVSGGADNSFYMVLPDGTLVEAENWSKDNPPKPYGLRKVELSSHYAALTPEALAVKMNAYMAELIS